MTMFPAVGLHESAVLRQDPAFLIQLKIKRCLLQFVVLRVCA